MKGYKPAVGQIGSQLQMTFNLFDGAIVNPDAALVLEFERMLNTDETVSASYNFLTLCVISFLGEYSHPDDRISSFMHECFESMDGSLALACEDILSAVWAGYSATEIVWKTDAGRLMLDYLATYHPNTITFHLDDRGRLLKVNQRRMFSALGDDIPPEKCIIFSYRKRFNNYYGASAFKPIRKNWLLKDAILKMWARALDRFGTPVLAAVVPDGTITDPETQQEISQLEYATKVLANLQSGTALAFSVKDAGGQGNQFPKIDALVTGGSGVGEAFDRAVGYLNKMISRGLLIPSLVFDEGARTGSLALGMSHFSGFLLMVQALFTQLKEVLLDQFVSRLITYNFGQQKDWGDFQKRQPSAEELKLYSEVFLNLVNSGLVDPTIEEDFKYARNTMGLPDRGVSATQARAAKAYERYYRAGQGGD